MQPRYQWTGETLRVLPLMVPGPKASLNRAGVRYFSSKPLEMIVLYTQITPLEELPWIYSNNIFLDELQSVVACGKTKLVFLYLFYILKKKKKNQKKSKLPNSKESMFTFTKYLAKLNLYSLLSLILIATKFQVTSKNCAGGYELFRSIPRIDFSCLGLKKVGQKKSQTSVTSTREGRKDWLNPSFCPLQWAISEAQHRIKQYFTGTIIY